MLVRSQSVNLRNLPNLFFTNKAVFRRKIGTECLPLLAPLALTKKVGACHSGVKVKKLALIRAISEPNFA